MSSKSAAMYMLVRKLEELQIWFENILANTDPKPHTWCLVPFYYEMMKRQTQKYHDVTEGLTAA